MGDTETKERLRALAFVYKPPHSAQPDDDDDDAPARIDPKNYWNLAQYVPTSLGIVSSVSSIASRKSRGRTSESEDTSSTRVQRISKSVREIIKPGTLSSPQNDHARRKRTSVQLDDMLLKEKSLLVRVSALEKEVCMIKERLSEAEDRIDRLDESEYVV